MKIRNPPRKLVANKRKPRANPLRVDPTRTATLRRTFVAELRRRFARLKALVVRLVMHEDALGLTPRQPLVNAETWTFRSDPEKLRAFREWLKTQVDATILGQSERDLFRRYAEQGFRKGAGRAFDDVRSRQPKTGDPTKDSLDFYHGTREEFLRSSFGRPVAVEKVELLASRAYSDLEGVTDAMGAQMARTLADSLVQGKGPREVARDLAEDVDGIGRTRAELIARTEIIRAHAEGQLEALQQLGVEEVGVMVEWRATPDGRTCPDCAAMEGTVLPLDEARGLIPMHPNCRCAWIPYIEDEETSKSAATANSASRMRAREVDPLEVFSSWLVGNANPNQARDEHGRFTAVASALAGHPHGVDPGLLTRQLGKGHTQKSVKAALSEMVSRGEAEEMPGGLYRAKSQKTAQPAPQATAKPQTTFRPEQHTGRLARAFQDASGGDRDFVDVAHLSKALGMRHEQTLAVVDHLRRQGILSGGAYEGRHGLSEEQKAVVAAQGGAREHVGYVSARDPEALRRLAGGA